MTPVLDRRLYSAIDILAYVSLNSSVTPVSSKAIADETGFGLRYVEQILQILVKATILKGVRGINGGYLISKDRRKIKLGDVYKAVLSLKIPKKDLNFSENSRDIVLEINENINLQIEKYLNEITLEDIYNKFLTNKKQKKNKGKSDFVI